MEMDTKFLKLSLFMDQSAAKLLNLSLDQTLAYMLECVNALDLVTQINVRVSLSYTEVWIAENRIKKNNQILFELNDFINLLAGERVNVIHDAALFLSATKFNKSLSFSAAHSVCSERAAGMIGMAEKISPYHCSVLMAHTLGHMMGMSGTLQIDKEKAAPLGIMEHQYEQNGNVYQFSNCSKEEFLSWIIAGSGHCLYNRPMQKIAQSKCGNKIIDEGEQCDCGNAEECESIDPCCVAHTCMLKADAQCSRGLCCDKCRCPPNRHILNGKTCGLRNDGYCYNGECRHASADCQEIWGPGMFHYAYLILQTLLHSTGASVANDMCFRILNMGVCFCDVSWTSDDCSVRLESAILVNIWKYGFNNARSLFQQEMSIDFDSKDKLIVSLAIALLLTTFGLLLYQGAYTAYRI
ncbi:Reprolysin and Disintegrin and ADAM CR domain con taining protein [Trichuris trichiura]|uniref:Reprolysin and Disintegrin and ADAM CR domain con taining protein n=1 Tax=Trichuris trichiura TaxID=36087 RepID=A0A077Z1N0_TRITR|nr:Reprolysin and Disintegrin and ADAM CR domain con taining protein [Trichuris trichiura]